MAREFTDGFYSTKAWLDCRKGFMQSKNYICERCGKPGIIAHHKIYLNENNINNLEITLNWDNLECLCLECHNVEHSNNKVIRNELMFDSNGNIIQK